MKKALIIGLNNYPNSPLSWCNNDADAVAKLIETNEDGSPNFDTIKIKDFCNKVEMQNAIKELFNDDVELSLLYFAGHGALEDGGYLCSTDISSGMLGVRMSDVLNYANQSKSKNRVIILDCCFSGNMGNYFDFGNGAYLGNGLTIIAACKELQYADENVEIGHGIFTNLLIEALKGGAADISGNITPAGIYSYIDQSLGAWQQRPVFKTNTSKFISLRTVNPKVPKDVIRNLSKYFESQDFNYNLDPSYEYTNMPEHEHKCLAPYANTKHVQVFKELQLLASVGLVEPVNSSYMYYAAMESKACKLTRLGQHYWRLARDKRL